MKPVRVSDRGAARWTRGHPWIFRSDLMDDVESAGVVPVTDPRGRFLGQALASPHSEIRLRLLDRTETPIDRAWWRNHIRAALSRREGIDANAFRVVHGEGDGLPSLVVDKYDRWLVAQVLSAGLETMRDEISTVLLEIFEPEGILLRNDVAVRKQEGLPEEIVLMHGTVPASIEIREGTVRYLASPWEGQKTGAFLDQRENRLLAGQLVRPGGTALDCFAYHGSFALHLAGRAGRVAALDASRGALARGTENAVLNGIDNIDWVEGDAFEALRDWERAGRRFDMVVVDPPPLPSIGARWGRRCVVTPRSTCGQCAFWRREGPPDRLVLAPPEPRRFSQDAFECRRKQRPPIDAGKRARSTDRSPRSAHHCRDGVLERSRVTS